MWQDQPRKHSTRKPGKNSPPKFNDAGDNLVHRLPDQKLLPIQQRDDCVRTLLDCLNKVGRIIDDERTHTFHEFHHSHAGPGTRYSSTSDYVRKTLGGKSGPRIARIFTD